jgi:hypothetical protein
MRTLSGGAPECENYTKAAAYGYAIYMWDPVTQLAGVLNGPASGITPGTTRYLGVSLNASVASTLATHLIMIEPGALYESQEDNSGGSNLVAAKMGYNANLTTTAGDATLKRSKVQVSGTSINTTSSLDVNIQRLLADPTNAYGAYGRVEIKFNKHLLNPEVTAT